MTRAIPNRPSLLPLVLCALFALACGGNGHDLAARPGDDRAEPAGPMATTSREPVADKTRDAGEPDFLDDADEVAMQALSVSVYGPGDAAECGLPEVDAGGGALVYFGCTPETGPVIRAVPARVAAPDPEAALAALLDGPTEAERERGYLSSFGPETASVGWTLGRRGSLVWVDFDRDVLDVEGLFVTPMDAAQIVATLGQFENTGKVLILVGGEPLCRAQGEC